MHLQYRKPGFDPRIGKIPWRRAWQLTSVFLLGESSRTEEPGELQPMRLQRFRHDWVIKCTHTHTHTHTHVFYLVGIVRTSSPGDRFWNCSQEVGWGVWLDTSLQQGVCSLNIKRLFLIKENQISQVKEFSTLLCMERYNHLGSLKSFLSYASQLPGASILLLDFSQP